MYISKLLVTTSAMLLVSSVGSLTQYQPQRVLAQSQTQMEKRPATPLYKSFLDLENKVLRSLNLTPDQTQKIQAIQDKYPLIQQQNRAAMTASAELRKMIDGDATTEQVRSKHRSVIELLQQASEERFEQQLAIREVLTVEQRRQRSAIIQNPTLIRALLSSP
jgi:Spy/CpxP family protein refolding chaperone